MQVALLWMGLGAIIAIIGFVITAAMLVRRERVLPWGEDQSYL